MHRQHDPTLLPNTRLVAARHRTSSSAPTGQCLSRGDLAELVNVSLDRLAPASERVHLHVDARWIGRLERGQVRRPCSERRAALRDVLATATDEELGLYRPPSRAA